MAFITKYTLNKLCADIDLDFQTTVQDFENTVFNNSQIYYLLSSRQNLYLFVYASLLKDIGGFRTKYFQFLKPKEDRLFYVNDDSGKYKYHLSMDCPMMNNNFKDFVIPTIIRQSGVEAIMEFRNWWSAMGFSLRFVTQEITLEKIKEEIRIITKSWGGIAN